MNYLRLYSSESNYENETRDICEYTISTIDRTYFVHWQGADNMSPSEDSSSDSSSSSSESPEIDYMNQYFTMVAVEAGEFKFIVPGSSVEVNNVEYSRDEGLTWISNSTTNDIVITVSVNAGDRVMWRCTGKINNNNYAVSSFRTTCKYDVEGNITSLIFGSPQNNCVLPEHAYTLLFTVCEYDGSEVYTVTGSNTNLRYAHNLYIGGDLTQMSKASCYSMFENCTYLLTMPNLLSVSLSNYCYYSMFFRCSSLNNRDPLSGQILSRILPANILPEDCYNNMFCNCTSLISTPQLGLNSSALYEFSEDSCHFMFEGCTSLTTIVGNSGYLFGYNVKTYGNYIFDSMFKDCTSLISCPYIKFTTYYITENNFNHSNGVCQYMFYNCSSLEYVDGLKITGNANSENNYLCYRMFYMLDPSSTNFYGFKDQLNFENIGGNHTYQDMFFNCTKLKVASDAWQTDNKLNFYNLTNYIKNTNQNISYAFYQMFYNCSSLTEITCENYTIAPGSYTFYQMFAYSGIIHHNICSDSSTTLPEYMCYGMFMGCSQLLDYFSIYPAKWFETKSCVDMYNGCSSLNYIDASSISSPSSTSCARWVNGVASSGTFVKKSGSSWSTGINGIPSGWTVVEK